MRKTFIILMTGAVLMAASSCGGTRKGTSSPAGEFFSGSLHFASDGVAMLTECTTRITMRLDHGGEYRELRRRFEVIEQGNDERARVEFYGQVLGGSDEGRADVPVVRVDTVVNISSSDDCLTDYLLPGIYRREGRERSVILRLQPRYTYVIQKFTPDDEITLGSGRWYRSSMLTIELFDETTGERSSFQVVPTRDSLARIDGGQTETYVREWL